MALRELLVRELVLARRAALASTPAAALPFATFASRALSTATATAAAASAGDRSSTLIAALACATLAATTAATDDNAQCERKTPTERQLRPIRDTRGHYALLNEIGRGGRWVVLPQE